MYEKIRMLVKPLEFLIMTVLPVIGLVFGGISLGWAITLIATYVVLKLTGWGTKKVQEVIDETKGNIEKAKDEIKKI